MSYQPVYWFCLCLAAISGAQAAPLPEGPALSLREALARTLEGSPALAAYSWEVRAAEARELQAGLRPNPELEFEVEELGVGSEEVEATVLLSQTIELGGKRAARIRLARSDQDLSRWDYERARADALERTAGAFVEVLGAQDRQALALELARLAEAVWETIDARVQAGRVSPLEADRAQVLLSLARLDVEDAGNALEAARQRLAANWGALMPDFGAVRGHLDTLHSLPEYEAVRAQCAQSADLARWEDEIRRSAAAVTLARSERIPDPALRLGYRRTGFSSRRQDNSVVLGFSIPLPLFDRNQGNIREAEHLARKTGEERRAAEADHHAALNEAYQCALAAYRRASQLKEAVLPQAASVSERTREGYAQGKFGYLEVLDAERAHFDLRTQYLDTLLVYHGAVLRIERLTGKDLFNLESKESVE